MKFDESILYDPTTGGLVKDHRGAEIFAHGVPDLSTSLEDGVNMTGEIASIGAIGYGDFATFKQTKGDEFANKRRIAYKKRHQKYRNIKGTNSYYADKILW